MATRENPSVAVCIVTFNSNDHIADCLTAVGLQTWPNLQIIVVDNASRDGTADTVHTYFRNVMLIRNARNVGFAAGQNQAIAATDADYVLVLNPDVTLAPDYIEKIIVQMEADPSIGSACGCLALKDDESIVDSTGLEMNWLRKAVERGGGRPIREYSQPCEIFGVSGAAAMYARRMIRHISVDGQFFDEDFFAYKEDVDVAWRAQKMGWKSWYEASARALHVRHWRSRAQRKQISLRIRKYSYQNRYLMIAKNETFDFRWWLKLPVMAVYEAALNGYMLMNDPKVLSSWAEMAGFLRRARRKRQLLKQALRRQT